MTVQEQEKAIQKKNLELSDIMTAPEVAEMLKFKVQHIYQLRAQHKIPYIKIGERVRFSRKKIEEWLEQQSQG